MSLILVVDDFAVVRESIATSLRAHGFSTLTASDGAEGLSLARSSSPDLVLLDLAMPVMDGLTLLRALREDPQTTKIPVILLTASSEKMNVVEAAKWGVRDYLLKAGCSMAEMLARVRKYTDGGGAAAVPGNAPVPVEVAASSALTVAVADGQRAPSAPGAPVATGTPRILTRDQTLARINACTDNKTLPGVVAEVMGLVNSPRGDAADLAAVLKRDPILASRVLQVANSAAFASQKPRIASIEEAVRNIGMSRVRGTVISVGIFESFPADGADGLGILRCWQHAFAVASLMEKLASATNARPAALAHLTGLCHDLGDIVLRQHFPQEQAEVSRLVAETARPRWQAEAAVYGMPYHELVMILLSKLGLPPTITVPIEEFFARAYRKDQTATGTPLSRALRICNVYAHGLMLAPSLDVPITPISTAEYRNTFNALPTSLFDDLGIRGEVLASVNVLAGLSSREAAQACEPPIRRGGGRIWYARHAGYCAFDPLHTLLSFVGDVQVHEAPPASPAELAECDALVVAASRQENPAPAQEGLERLAQLLAARPLPLLYLSGVGPENLRVSNTTALRLPVTLGQLAAFSKSIGT